MFFEDPANLKRLSGLLQWFAIGLVFLGGVLQLLRFVVDQREKSLSLALSQQKETARVERENALRADLEQSRAELELVATRDTFRPLSPKLRLAVVNSFRQLVQSTKTPLKVSISIENGSRNRALIRNELLQILNEAGISASAGSTRTTLYSGVLPHLKLRLSAASLELGNSLVQGLSVFMKVEFPASKDETMPLGTFELDIFGEPQFLPDGSIVYK